MIPPPSQRTGDPAHRAPRPSGRRHPTRPRHGAGALALLAALLPAPIGPRPDLDREAHVHLVDAALDEPARINRPLLVIAHNAGDTSTGAQLALAHGAGSIEIDVRLEQDRLLAAHSTPRPEALPSTRTLPDAWAELPPTSPVLLDVKTSTMATADGVARAIAAHPPTTVFVSSPDDRVLARLAPRAPTALRLRTTRSRAEIAEVVREPGAAQGVAVPAKLLDEPTVLALRARGLWVQAYCVNSMRLANRLAAWGVNGITTDTLTIMSALHVRDG